MRIVRTPPVGPRALRIRSASPDRLPVVVLHCDRRAAFRPNTPELSLLSSPARSRTRRRSVPSAGWQVQDRLFRAGRNALALDRPDFLASPEIPGIESWQTPIDDSSPERSCDSKTGHKHRPNLGYCGLSSADPARQEAHRRVVLASRSRFEGVSWPGRPVGSPVRGSRFLRNFQNLPPLIYVKDNFQKVKLFRSKMFLQVTFQKVRLIFGRKFERNDRQEEFRKFWPLKVGLGQILEIFSKFFSNQNRSEKKLDPL